MVVGGILELTLSALAQAQDANLDRVLTQMDTVAKDFHTLQAAFVWDQYTKVVKDTDTSKGNVYYQREGSAIKMAADIVTVNGSDAPKTVLFADGEVKMYEPRADPVMTYQTRNNRPDVKT